MSPDQITAPAVRPKIRPSNACFSSGPCAKRPGFSLAALDGALLGRSHRAHAPKARIAEVIDRSASVLGIPEGWRLAVVPASDTGAVEMAMWSLLGPLGVDVIAFESFSRTWAADITGQLRLADTRVLAAPYGALPDLAGVDPGRDVVLAWNGTTSGVRVPDGDWISAARDGLVICDATSAAFAMRLPWEKLDAVTWSWQKVLGGEAGHGMLALSPRALARLAAHAPTWPMPKLFRLADAGVVHDGIFRGETINTPSLLCVEDALDGLRWAERVGGLAALVARSEANLAAVARWIEGGAPWAFLAADPATRSSTSICICPIAAWFTALSPERQARAARAVAAVLEREGVAFDIASYRDAPPGLRIWGGATVDAADVAALMHWIDWAHDGVRCEMTGG